MSSHPRARQQVGLSSVSSCPSDSVCSLQVQQQALGRLRPAPPPQDQACHSREGQQIQVGGEVLSPLSWHSPTPTTLLSSHEDCLETREFSQTCTSEDLTAGIKTSLTTTTTNTACFPRKQEVSRWKPGLQVVEWKDSNQIDKVQRILRRHKKWIGKGLGKL